MLGNAPVITMIPVIDVTRADAFYRGVLGLRPYAVDAPDGIFYEAGEGTRLGLYRRGPTVADHTVCTFVVPDIEAMIDALVAKGVVFEQYDLPGLKTDARGIALTGGTRSAWFKDTEGNILSITEL